MPIRASGASLTVRSMPLARAKACTAGSLNSCSRRSCSCGVSTARMFNPPAGMAKPGITVAARARLMAMDALASTVSCTHFRPTQQPLYRDKAQPNKPKSTMSCTPAGLSTGIMASIIANSLWWQVVEDSHVWSSPNSARTPPNLEVPARLAWRRASPLRSTPGPLPYHMPNTPW